MIVQVTQVNIPAGSTIAFGTGIDDEGREVTFVGDHRPMYHMGCAVGAGEVVEVELESWQVTHIKEVTK